MERYVKIFLVIGVLLLLAGTAYAQHLGGGWIDYDSRYFPQFYHGRGGLEGHSGAYIHLWAQVLEYSQIRNIRIRAENIGTRFRVSLIEDSPGCVGSLAEDVQYFSVFLKVEEWMEGEWEFTMQYRDSEGRKTETATATVNHFNFPAEPTGVEIAENNGKTILVWNRIGDPSIGSGERIEYVIFHFSESPRCLDELLRINPEGYPYELLPGNRIAVELPSHWNSGDRIRIENRIYDSSPTNGHPFDRAVKYVILP